MTMRWSLWLFLILAFSTGMCCALSIRFFYFEAPPVIAQTTEPTTKILFAKRMIPSGIEITAEFVVFQDVPVSEVPSGSLTSFAQVHRRQPAGSIPAGYPIFEDLLLPQAATSQQTAFVPTGSQLVTLDVVHLRQGDKVFVPKEPLSTLLSTNQRIDIRVVPPEAQGRLAEKKQELLRTLGTQDMRNSGELLLENVPIHRIQRKFVADDAGSARDALELMLEKSEADRLTAAARKGQIRIFVRQDATPQPQRAEIDSIVAEPFSGVAASPTTVSDPFVPKTPPSNTPPPDSQPLAQPWTLDIPPRSSALPEAFGAVPPVEQVQRIAPTPPDIADLVSPPTPAKAMWSLARVDALSQDFDQQSLELVAEEIDAIRNEGSVSFGHSESVIAFGPVPFRTVTPESPPVVEFPQTATEFPLLTNATGQETFVPAQQSLHDHTELTMGTPRSTHTIEFLSPGGGAPVRTYPQAMPQTMIWQVEPAVGTQLVMPTVMPSAIPLPQAISEKIPEYTPFERRIYTVLPVEEFGRSPNEELLAPQRLPRSSDPGTQTQ